MITSSNGNISRVTCHLYGEFTGLRWIPRTKSQWRGALIFSLICVWINGWVNNCEAGDLRRYRAHYNVIVICKYRPFWPVLNVFRWHIWSLPCVIVRLAAVVESARMLGLSAGCHHWLVSQVVELTEQWWSGPHNVTSSWWVNWATVNRATQCHQQLVN